MFARDGEACGRDVGTSNIAIGKVFAQVRRRIADAAAEIEDAWDGQPARGEA